MGIRRFEIVTEGKGLGMKAGGDTSWILYFTSDSDFLVKENRGMVKFEFAPDGKVTGFITNGMKARKTD